MGLDTKIAWTDSTWNLAWGCMKVSPGCANCYAEGIAREKAWDVWGKDKPLRVLGPDYWNEPRKWNRAAEKDGKRHRVFCSSMTDWAMDHPGLVPLRARLWDLVRETPWLDWQLLTKRPENIRRFLPNDPAIVARLWLGVSIESQEYAFRADALRSLPCAVRFISYEPALGPLDDLDLTGIDWVIFGGESGPTFRPMKVEWARTMRDRCRTAGVAFYFKQSAARWTEMGVKLDGEMVREYPTPRHAHLVARPLVNGDLFAS